MGGLDGLAGLGGLGGLGGLTNMVGTKGLDIGQNIKKKIHELTSDKNENEPPSSMGDYINKTDKSKTFAGNQKVIIEENSTDIKNEMTTEVENVNVALKLNSSEIEDFKKFDNILNSEVSNTVQTDEKNEENEDNEENEENEDKTRLNNDVNIEIDNNNINKQDESEKLLNLFKKMNDIFSTEEQSSTVDNTNENKE